MNELKNESKKFTKRKMKILDEGIEELNSYTQMLLM